MIIENRITKAKELQHIVNLCRYNVKYGGCDNPVKYRHYADHYNNEPDLDDIITDSIKPVHIKHEPFVLYYNPKDNIDENAERESIAIKQAFKPKTMDFGKRKNSNIRLNNQISAMPKVVNHRHIWKKITL